MNKVFWIILGVTIATLVGIFVLFNDKAEAPAVPKAEIPLALTDQEHTKGSRDASVQLIEYADFQCPACRAIAPYIDQVIKEYGDRIGVTIRHFPLPSHNNAQAAARTAEAAGTQNKFFEMATLLFERQNEWEASPTAKTKFEDYAQELGLNLDQFKETYSSNSTRDRINRDVTTGKDAEVNGTPTIFINGEKIQNPASYEELKKIIDAKLNQ